jgi:hypothetical protein
MGGALLGQSLRSVSDSNSISKNRATIVKDEAIRRLTLESCPIGVPVLV